MHRARQLRRICNHYILDTVESPILGEVVYVDTEFGSPLYGWRDIHWSWEATGDSQRWRISGYMGPDGDQDFVTLAVTDFVEVAMLTKLVRSKRPYLYTGSGSDPDLVHVGPELRRLAPTRRAQLHAPRALRVPWAWISASADCSVSCGSNNTRTSTRSASAIR
jgi:hypothetical protein